MNLPLEAAAKSPGARMVVLRTGAFSPRARGNPSRVLSKGMTSTTSFEKGHPDCNVTAGLGAGDPLQGSGIHPLEKR